MKYYENRRVVLLLQSMSMVTILFMQIDLMFKGMFLLGYFLLFWQERWHKHLGIMLIMIMIVTLSSYYVPMHI